MLQRTTGWVPSAVEHRFMINTSYRGHSWIVIVEPDVDESRLVVFTAHKGRPFAAYLYLAQRSGEKSARTEASPDGLLVVDYADDGRPTGVEITAPAAGPTPPPRAGLQAAQGCLTSVKERERSHKGSSAGSA